MNNAALTHPSTFRLQPLSLSLAGIARPPERLSRTRFSTVPAPRTQTGPRNSGVRLRLDRCAFARGNSHSLPGKSSGIVSTGTAPHRSLRAARPPGPRRVRRDLSGHDTWRLGQGRAQAPPPSGRDVGAGLGSLARPDRTVARTRSIHSLSGRISRTGTQAISSSSAGMPPAPIAASCLSAADGFPSTSSHRLRGSLPRGWPRSNRGPACTARFNCRTSG